MHYLLGVVTSADIFLFVFVLLAVVGLLIFLAWFGWRMTWKKIALSPYTGLPLRYGRDIGYNRSEQIYRFLYNMKQYDNRMFDLNKAAFCRETGRIFPSCVTFLDTIDVDWSFLQKRLKGDYVSWGSLNNDQQLALRSKHGSLRAFQTEISSTEPLPRMVDPESAYSKPGPLYVDITNDTLVGWQIVPDTEFEVLIVQKPTKVLIQKSE